MLDDKLINLSVPPIHFYASALRVSSETVRRLFRFRMTYRASPMTGNKPNNLLSRREAAIAVSIASYGTYWHCVSHCS